MRLTNNGRKIPSSNTCINKHFKAILEGPKRCLKHIQINLVKLFLPNWLIYHKQNIWTWSAFWHIMYVTLHTWQSLEIGLLSDRSLMFWWLIMTNLGPQLHGGVFRQSMAWNQVFSTCLHFVIGRVKLQHLFEHLMLYLLHKICDVLRCFLMH